MGRTSGGRRRGKCGRVRDVQAGEGEGFFVERRPDDETADFFPIGQLEGSCSTGAVITQEGGTNISTRSKGSIKREQMCSRSSPVKNCDSDSDVVLTGARIDLQVRGSTRKTGGRTRFLVRDVQAGDVQAGEGEGRVRAAYGTYKRGKARDFSLSVRRMICWDWEFV